MRDNTSILASMDLENYGKKTLKIFQHAMIPHLRIFGTVLSAVD
jgi:hypothetical protein